MEPRPICVIMALLILALLLFCCFGNYVSDLWNRDEPSKVTVTTPTVVYEPTETVRVQEKRIIPFTEDVMVLHFGRLRLEDGCPTEVGCFTTPLGNPFTVWMQADGEEVLIGFDSCVEVKSVWWTTEGVNFVEVEPAAEVESSEDVALPTATVPRGALSDGRLYIEFADERPNP